MTKTITSLNGFVHKISNVTPAEDELLLYRGHSNRKEFKLIPSVMRDDTSKLNEYSILRELVASHPSEFITDPTTFDRLVRVQHYSLPSRLLDVTWNPLVSLFFATDGYPDVAGEVIVFRVKKSSIKYYDSDTVSCISNLAHLKVEEKNQIDFSLTDMGEFNKQKPIDRLVQFIKMEKPHFRPEIKAEDLKRVVCVKPKKSNPRIIAQSGAFFIFGLCNSLDDMCVDGISTERIIINKSNKLKIRKELDRLSINDSTMFPEIEKAAIYIKRNM